MRIRGFRSRSEFIAAIRNGNRMDARTMHRVERRVHDRTAGAQPSMDLRVQRRNLSVCVVCCISVLHSATARSIYSENISSPMLVFLTFRTFTSPANSTVCGIFFNPTTAKWGRILPACNSRKLAVSIERRSLANARNCGPVPLHRRWK